MRWGLGLLACLLLAGCHDAGLDALTFGCDDDGDCAGGFVCAWDAAALANTCQVDGAGAAATNPCAELEAACPAEGLCGPTVCVDASSGVVGCDEGCDEAHGPARPVTSAPFLIDATEVTRARFAAFLATGATCAGLGCFDDDAEDPPLSWDTASAAWIPTAKSDALPMTEVTWWGAQAFCEAAGRTLCTEAQWELAARGGCEVHGEPCAEVTPPFPWGEEAPTCEHAVMATCGGPFAVPAADAGASPYGAWDLAGNVSEWVLDCWHADLSGAPGSTAQWTASCDPSGDRTVRGAGFEHPPEDQGAARREPAHKDTSRADLGFRCCGS